MYMHTQMSVLIICLYLDTRIMLNLTLALILILILSTNAIFFKNLSIQMLFRATVLYIDRKMDVLFNLNNANDFFHFKAQFELLAYFVR